MRQMPSVGPAGALRTSSHIEGGGPPSLPHHFQVPGLARFTVFSQVCLFGFAVWFWEDRTGVERDTSVVCQGNPTL